MHGWFNIQKSINVFHYIIKLKEKKNIILLDVEKSFDKIQHTGIQGPYLKIVKAIHRKPVVNIKLNGEKLEAIPQKSGTRQYCPVSNNLFNIILEVLATIGGQIDTNWKRKVKLLLFADDIIVYLKDPKNSTREFQQLKNKISTVAGYKINSNKSVAFLYSKDK